VALPQTGLPETAGQIINDHHVEVKYCELDLTDEGAIIYLYQWCRKQNSKINMLINNAGIGTHASFECTSIPELETMLKLNNHALVMLAYYFLPDLKRNRPAHILNVGSLASFMNIPGKAVYAASKSFIYSFSLSLRMELRPYEINVSCLCPGGTLTSSQSLKNMDKVRFAGKMLLQMPAQVAKEAVIEMYQRKRIIIPGWHNRFLYKLWAFLPQRIVDMILTAVFYKSDVSRKMKAKTAIAFHAILAR
jgi:uncharacterized protein